MFLIYKSFLLNIHFTIWVEQKTSYLLKNVSRRFTCQAI